MTHHLPAPSRRRLLAAGRGLVAAALTAGLLVATVPAGASTSSELAATKARIEQTLAELEQVNGAKEQTEDELAAAQRNVEQLEADLNDLLAAMNAQEERVALARSEAAAAGAERDRIAQIVGERARRAFMGGDSSPIMLLGTGGMDDFNAALDGLAILDALASRADASIETLDVARVQADASAEILEGEVAALEEVRAAHEQLLAQAEDVLAERALALKSLEIERERLMAEQEELEQEAEQIQQLIDERAAAARRAAERAAREAAEAAAAAAAAAEAAETSGNDAPAEAAEPAPKADPPKPASGCYAWPANGRVTSEYGPRWGRLHAGLDIDGDTGDPLYAAQSGTVIYVGYYSGYGNLTLISHSDGITTAYAHQSAFGVSEGQNVARGEYIGKLGATGRVTGSHLHFETRTSNGTRNPRNYLC